MKSKGARICLPGVLLVLVVAFAAAPVPARDDGEDRRARLTPEEIAPFLGKWTGTHWQLIVRTLQPRPMRMDVRQVKREGRGQYRATIFMGIIKPNVGMLRTRAPKEKDRKVRFRTENGVRVMKIRMGRRDYDFVLKGNRLEGTCTSAPDRTCSLTRPE